MQYLGAIRKILKNKVQLKRTIHVTFVPDEEIFGPDGMKAFVQSEDFKQLNVGFLLDEGIASETEVFKVFYGEKTCWRKHLDIFLVTLIFKMIRFRNTIQNFWSARTRKSALKRYCW